MKKCTFYSLISINGVTTAKQWQGWTDGEYNYYKSRGMWSCILPACGRSVAKGETRIIARDNAVLLTKQIEQVRNSKEWPNMVERFELAKMEAQK